MDVKTLIIESEYELKEYEVFKNQLIKIAENVYHNYLYEFKYIYDNDKLIRVVRRKL